MPPQLYLYDLNQESLPADFVFSDEDRQRAQLKASPALQEEFLLQRYLIYRSFQAEYERLGGRVQGRLSEFFQLDKLPEGKPYLKSRDFEFSISHSGSHLVVACSQHRVGVDLEVKKPRSFVQLAERYFAPDESELLRSLKGSELSSEFYRIWTLKEAWIKSQGSQLASMIRESTLVAFGDSTPSSLQAHFQDLGNYVLSYVEELPPLFRRYPVLEESVRRLPLIQDFTPLRELKAWSQVLDLGDVGRLLLKDDSQTHPDFGGNKLRKLEFYLGEAISQVRRGERRAFDQLVTLGFVGSNHCVATSMVARELGLSCGVYLHPQLSAKYVELNLSKHEELGTQIWGPDDLDVDKPFPSLEDLEPLVADPEATLWVSPGGTHPTTHWGYINAAFELAEQLQGQEPDLVYMACGTTGSCVGMMIGMKLLGWQTQLVAVQVVPDFLVSPIKLVKSCRVFNTQLKSRGIADLSWATSDLRLHTGAYGEGYAIPTAASELAVDELLELESLHLEWTYTAKVVDAIQQDSAAGLLRNQCVVMVNTYGEHA